MQTADTYIGILIIDILIMGGLTKHGGGCKLINLLIFVGQIQNLIRYK